MQETSVIAQILTQLRDDPEALRATFYVGASMAGMVLSATRKMLEGETACISSYFFTEFPRRSILAAIANFTAAAAFVATGAIGQLTHTAAIALGLFTGYTADGAINKGHRSKWGPRRRREEREDPQE